MAQLAIKGHATRGREVIELLEMLGGGNPYRGTGNPEDVLYFTHNNVIQFGYNEDLDLSNFIIFTLEEFLEKFPYKIGDKVLREPYVGARQICEMRWDTDNNCIKYGIGVGEWFNVSQIQPYKEETMDRKYNVEEYLKVWEETERGLEVVVNDSFELKEDNGKFYIIKKQPQYPKTYGECCEELGHKEIIISGYVLGYKGSLLSSLQKLLICRDAHWKIAGEQMGLGKSWEPDWLNTEQDKFVLYTHDNVICLNRFVLGHNVLAFPTEEMRDTFLENFKELIELCKEFL